jgi:hypothetical protein
VTKKAEKDKTKDKRKPHVKDLSPGTAHQAGMTGGKTKHDTAKNSISNVR